ncbi:MAG: hypothetical protein RL885_30115 [Planctomycetota bacterium]
MMMRHLLLLTLLLLTACSDPETFGTLDGPSQKVTVGDVLESKETQTVLLEGTISKECPSGCWFYAQDESGEVRVELAGTGITLPQRVGSKVTVRGDVSVDDDGVVQILGTGVRIH